MLLAVGKLPGKEGNLAPEPVPAPAIAHGWPIAKAAPDGSSVGKKEGDFTAAGLVSVNLQLADASPGQFGFDQLDRLGFHAGAVDRDLVHKLFIRHILRYF